MGLKEAIIGKNPKQYDVVERCISFLNGGDPVFSPSEVDKAKSTQTVLTLKNNPQDNEKPTNYNPLQIFPKAS